MAGSRTTFEKLQRDRAKKARAEAKRAKRMGKEMPGAMPQDEAAPTDSDVPFEEQLDDEISASDLLRLVEQLQAQFDNDEIDFDEYEERKFELLARLPTD
jgi:hypothetical protein